MQDKVNNTGERGANNTATPHGAHSNGSAPDALPVLLENIPLELRDMKQWVCWRYEVRDGKSTKVPYQPGGNKAAVDKCASWRGFDVISKAYATGKWDGIGFVLSDDDEFSGVDLDGMINAETGEFSDEANAILSQVNSYSEISPSGRGVRIWTRGKLPEGRRRKGKIEAYDGGRYLTITGHRIDGTPDAIGERTDELAQFHALYLADDAKTQNTPPSAPGEPLSLSDAELVTKAREARNGAKFSALYDGVDGGGVSEGDAALCALLAFWTQRDGGRMDSLFRASGRMREKWDSSRGNSTYGANEIERAIERCGEVYDPSSRRARQVRHDDDEADEKAALTLGYPLTDTGNAERFLSQHEQNIRFCGALGWLVWNSNRWAEDERGRIFELGKASARRIYVEAANIEDDGERAATAKWAKSSEALPRREAMLKLAGKDNGDVKIDSCELDANPWLFNVANGTFDLDNGTFHKSHRRDLITKYSPVIYDPNADCPNFLMFLRAIFDGDVETAILLQRLVGYTLTGSTREQILAILHGNGANGKSTLLNVIRGICGDYARHTPPDTMMKKKFGEGIPTDVARLRGARLVTAIETNESRQLDEAKVKEMTGGDPVTARFMRKDFFEFTPEFKLYLATNHLPQITGGDDGIWRRIRTIPFNVTFWDPDKGQDGPPHLRADKMLPERLKSEMSGILNWALAGCMDWQENGIPQSEAVANATRTYRDESDPVEQFLNDCCTINPNCSAPNVQLFAAFTQWAEADEMGLSQKEFSNRMKRKKFTNRRGHGGARIWNGVGLLTAEGVQ